SPVGGSDELAVLDEFIRQSRQELHERERERARLLGFIKDELDEPLGKLEKDVADILSRSQKLTEKGRDRFERVLIELSRMRKLIEDLLAMDEIKLGEVQLHIAPVDLDDMISSAVHSVFSAAEKKSVEIETSISGLTALADADRTAQLLVNLLSNAIR